MELSQLVSNDPGARKAAADAQAMADAKVGRSAGMSAALAGVVAPTPLASGASWAGPMAVAEPAVAEAWAQPEGAVSAAQVAAWGIATRAAPLPLVEARALIQRVERVASEATRARVRESLSQSAEVFRRGMLARRGGIEAEDDDAPFLAATKLSLEVIFSFQQLLHYLTHSPNVTPTHPRSVFFFFCT